LHAIHEALCSGELRTSRAWGSDLKLFAENGEESVASDDSEFFIRSARSWKLESSIVAMNATIATHRRTGSEWFAIIIRISYFLRQLLFEARFVLVAGCEGTN